MSATNALAVALAIALAGCAGGRGGATSSGTAPSAEAMAIAAPAPPTAAGAFLPTTENRLQLLAVVQDIVDQRCGGCHDEDNRSLDLTPRLTVEDKRLRPMLLAVTDFRMPPTPALEGTHADTTAELRARFPMATAERARLMKHIEALLSTPPEPPTQLGLSIDQRFIALKQIAAQWLEPARIEAIAHPLLSTRHAFVVDDLYMNQSAMGELKFRLIALGLCREIARVDASTTTLDRARIGRFLSETYATAPTAAELDAAEAMAARFGARVTAPDTAFVALCTTHLSGPRLGTLALGPALPPKAAEATR